MFKFLVFILAVIGGWFGAYIGSYMKKKGENLATHEDLDKIVKQIEATTSATKSIEARISNEVWGRQKHWEMKRDALVSALQALEHADVALMEMATVFENAQKNGEQSETEWKQVKLEKTWAWQESINSYDDKLVIVNLVCNRATYDALRIVGKVIRSNASKLFKRAISGYDNMGHDVHKQMIESFTLARKELGVDSE